MNKILLLVFLTGGLLYSQSFTMTCETLVQSGPPGSSFIFEPQLTNLSGNTIQIKIARRLNQLPTSNWSSNICYGSCYPSDIDTITDEMPYPFSGITFTFDVQTDSNVPGIAQFTLAVVNRMDENDFQQLTFTVNTTSTDIDEDKMRPGETVLMQNYPNPFNPSTTINYRIPVSNGTQRSQLIIYNSLGQKIRTLVNARRAPGNYSVQWDGRDDAGIQVSSGVYLYRLTCGILQTTKKMVLTR